jgi:DNA-binding NtrC family response regulator
MSEKATPSVLVVDDEPDICQNLCDILTDLGYRVDTAQDGRAALDLVRRRRYDVAVLDLMMPGMDGVELFEEIQKLRSGTVALLVTAYPNHPRAESAHSAGVFRVLPKPVDFPDLLALIDEAGGRPLAFVVDDDPALCANLRDLLADRGYRVCVAPDERTATNHLRDDGFDIILLHMRLPDGSGASVFQKVREVCPDTPVLVISAHPQELDPIVGRLLAQGAKGFFPKPFDIPKLLETLDQLARPGHG